MTHFPSIAELHGLGLVVGLTTVCLIHLVSLLAKITPTKIKDKSKLTSYC